MMNTNLTCAVITFSAENNCEYPNALSRSIAAAKAHSMGIFSKVVEQTVEHHTAASHYNAAVKAARNLGAEWILFITPDETLNVDAFALAEPALRVHDAVWGAASLCDGNSVVEPVVRKSRLACHSYEEFFHLALRWWIGKSYFIKTKIAELYTSFEDTDLWRMKHLVHMWENHLCLKTAHPLTTVHHALSDLDEHEREYLLHYLDEHPVYRTVHGGLQSYKLPYTGRNPVIEREQTRGIFYEEDELRYLVTHIPSDAVIVDVGANTGNHTVYFSLFTPAQKIIPIEPTPHAITALKRAVAVNNLHNIDDSKLGVGAGADYGAYSLKLSQGGGLGATRLKANTDGDIQVVPLDDLIQEPIDFMKIDVETMEMEVLKGAQNLITQHQPLIFIEIENSNIEAFLHWIDTNTYQIEKIFPDKSHANYLISPINTVNHADEGGTHA